MRKNVIKAYQQIEHSDCGITCIRIIARYYGRVIPLSILRSMCDVGRMGISLRDIIDCMRKLGFHAEAVKVGRDDLLRMPLPAVMYWDQCHYVVLYNIRGEKFYIADPSRGKISLSGDEFFRHWMMSDNAGLAVVADPTDKFYTLELPRTSGLNHGLWNMVCRTVFNNRLSFAVVLLLLLVAMIADVFTPVLFQHTVDDGINGRNIPLVWLLVVGQFLVFLGNYVSSNVAHLILTKTGLRMGMNMVDDYLSKLIRLPMSFFDRKVASDLIQKIDDQNRLMGFLLDVPQLLFFTIANLVVFSCLMLYYNYWVYIIFLLSVASSFIWTQLHLARRKAIDYSHFSYASENRNNVYELVNGMQEIKINNAQLTRVKVWNKVQTKINALAMRSALLNLSVESGNMFLLRIRDIIITGLCATWVVKGQLTIGEMMTINYIAGRLALPFDNLVSIPRRLQDASISYERLDEILNKSKDNSKNNELSGIQNATLHFDNVSFKYPGSYSPYVINNFTAIIEQGKTTAIVGPSGCGKTTLLKLMLGFYVPQKGILKIGNMDVADVDNDEWLRYCGVVMQNGYVFSGTILENIALSETNPDEDKVREAARLACIDDYFSSLPMGYHTRLGNAGLELSGGQKQRLFIARAVYKNPQFLFLDEATSSLDANNESAIVQNLARYNKGRTVVVAAHRLSTVRHADKIIYMDKGDLVEEGMHEELVARRGAYYRLVREQLDSN